MKDRITANLPSRDLERTATFYQALGFEIEFKDRGWMILSRGPLEVEFFPLRQDPRKNCFSACIRVADLDGLHAAFQVAGLSSDCSSIPRLSWPEAQHGLRIFALVDPDGNLLRCIENRGDGSG